MHKKPKGVSYRIPDSAPLYVFIILAALDGVVIAVGWLVLLIGLLQ